MKRNIRTIRRGDIYLIDCGKTVGSEQGGIRPAVVIQNNMGNRYSPTTIVAMITSSTKKHLPTHVQIDRGLEMQSCVLLEQIRTISIDRLKQYIVTLDRSDMIRIDNALRESLAI
ncbi:MAG: type II toxin-antitoxin system PemK/MazF family toxin [Oscillospiraceae bacterium]|nr:type II toxin-antitoxin system PemK/MazF family toxin [Oscillospiraceae bacterium]MDE5769690.1 type II toxin-antitoxin system PemK/MazF family toxin [Oscillospiraceae bacterium]MDE5885794.1 type II toxin-antitoxin system PemK/MazF family toxin [Oscillospiraceae bacterium]